MYGWQDWCDWWCGWESRNSAWFWISVLSLSSHSQMPAVANVARAPTLPLDPPPTHRPEHHLLLDRPIPCCCSLIMPTPPNVRGRAMKKKENNKKKAHDETWMNQLNFITFSPPSSQLPLSFWLFLLFLYLFILKDRKDVFKNLSSVLGSGRRATGDCGDV